MKHNNKGYSLVEMIAVLAILATMLGSAISLIGYMSGSKAKSAAYTIQSAINKARTEAMSKSTGSEGSVPGVKDVYLKIEQDSANDFYVVLQSKTSEVREYLGNNRLEIQGGGNSIDKDHPLYIDFKRDTGSLYTHPAIFDGITEITVKQGNVTYRVSFVRVTGKVSLSRG